MVVEKGGKVPVSKKSSMKTTTGKGGKDGGSSNSKRVLFDSSSDSEGSPRAHVNSASKSSGKDSGKGGKGGKGGDKSGKGAGLKSSAPKVPTPPELNIEKGLPKGTKCLMDCEAATILQGIEEQLLILSKDPTIKLPGAFNKGLEYAKARNRYTNSESVRKILQTLRPHNISEGEICMIANVCPETADEAFALIPSLKVGIENRRNHLHTTAVLLNHIYAMQKNYRFRTEGPIKNVLVELAKLKIDEEDSTWTEI